MVANTNRRIYAKLVRRWWNLRVRKGSRRESRSIATVVYRRSVLQSLICSGVVCRNFCFEIQKTFDLGGT